MPRTRESVGTPFPPPDERRLAVGNQLETQIAVKAGEYVGMTPSGRPLVRLRDGYECVVPIPSQLFDFVSIEVASVQGETYDLLVTGALPEHKSAFTDCEPRDIAALHCRVRLEPKASPPDRPIGWHRYRDDPEVPARPPESERATAERIEHTTRRTQILAIALIGSAMLFGGALALHGTAIRDAWKGDERKNIEPPPRNNPPIQLPEPWIRY